MAFIIAAHILFVTLGFGGLIVPNVWLALAVRGGDTQLIAPALRITLAIERIGGPLLGVGVLFGIATLVTSGVPPFSSWLVASYIVIVLAIAVQIVTVRAQIATASTLSAGSGAAVDAAGRVATRAAALFAAAFALLVFFMTVRP